jgi:hypothetical protein
MEQVKSLREQIELNQIDSILIGKIQSINLNHIKHLSPLSDLGGIESFANLLVHNTSLIRLSFSEFCFIGPEGAKLISEAIKMNSILQKINLSGNYIEDEGAKWISEAIKMNSSLQEINLSGNSIGEEGAKWISEGIKVNSTLQELNLSHNFIGDEGVKWIAKGIEMNTSLCKIDLSENSALEKKSKF